MVNYEHYTYRVTWSAEDEEYVGLCAEFPSLSLRTAALRRRRTALLSPRRARRWAYAGAGNLLCSAKPSG